MINVISGEGNDTFSIPKQPQSKQNATKSSWNFTKVEEIEDIYNEEDKGSNASVSQGIVEEWLDSEYPNVQSRQTLEVNRGVSIVSLSEDERTLSRNDSNSDINDKKLEEDEESNDKRNFERKESSEESPQKYKTNKSDYMTSPTRADVSDSDRDCSFSKITKKKEENFSSECIQEEMFEAPLIKPGLEGKPDIDYLSEPDFALKSNAAKESNLKINESNSYSCSDREGENKNVEKIPVRPQNELENESNPEEDPVMKDLLKRIQKQRSVLEDIMTKEAENQNEGI